MWFHKNDQPFRMEKTESGAKLLRYAGKEETVIIPDEFEGAPVTGIGEGAFYDNSKIREVEIPDTVTEIGMNAFRGAKKLARVKLSKNLVQMGEHAFTGCQELESVRFPKTLGAIPAGSFSKCASLQEISLPDSVKQVGEEAFSQCANLRAADLGAGVETLGEDAFRGCAKELCVIIPDGLKTVSEKTLAGCDRVYARVPGGLMLKYYTGHEQKIALDDECAGLPVVAIGPRVFEMFAYLKEIKLPKALEIIGDGCFAGCSGISQIEFPATLREIGKAAFAVRGLERAQRGLEENTGLTSLTLPKFVEKIGDGAFYGHRNLKTLAFSAPVPQMGSGVFANCGMEKVSLPQGTVEVQSETFKGCENLIEVNLPETLESVWEFAFAECVNLKTVNLPKSLEVVGEFAFMANASLSESAIPEKTREIGVGAFAGCDSLSRITVHPGNSVFEVSDGLLIKRAENRVTASVRKRNAKNVLIPYGTEAVDAYAFQGCNEIESVSIPSTVQKIGAYAFAGCENLKKITCDGAVNEVEADALYGLDGVQIFADEETKEKFLNSSKAEEE